MQNTNIEKRAPKFIVIKVLFFYKFYFLRHAGIGVFLQKYNHLQPSEEYIFHHGGINS